ncbi:MAG: FprA family A-type flavoprotein [Oligoflexia bacterium]|nr:FprA family A-type flavoprotein [Oligoflexia bacterium]
MLAREIKPNIFWVGGIDWNLRNFHGYSTERGSTYNAYLIIDEKVTLVDTVKHHLVDEMLERIRSIIDPSKIDYIVSNHVEMDHSGGLPRMMELAPNAVIVTSVNGESGLKNHFATLAALAEKNFGKNFKVVKQGDSLSLGKYTLNFAPIPMVHWPDSMVTYVPEAKLLLSNDAFGQHLASEHLFDYQVGWAVVREEAAKYYANIVLPYDKNVQAALTAIKNLRWEIDMIAPSHGVILTEHISDLLELYQRWSTHSYEHKHAHIHPTHESRPQAVIIYDTMWGSTEKMAKSIQSALETVGLPVSTYSLTHSHISNIITAVMEARYVFIGSPTLNNQMLPTMAAMISYMLGLKPRNKIGFVFGSYGWGGQATKLIEEALRPLDWNFPTKAYAVKYIPTTDALVELQQLVTDSVLKLDSK